MSEALAPVAFFAYKRPDHTHEALQALARCRESKNTSLFVFCDGPREGDDPERLAAVRAVARSKPWCGNVHVVERERNLGLANSMVEGITTLVERFERVCVLEDDVVVSPRYLHYVNAALNRYRDDDRVMHISAFMWPIEIDGLSDTFFLRSGSSWGCALWQRSRISRNSVA